MRAAARLLSSVIVAPLLFAAEAIFPTPLHLTRQVHDPISAKTSVIQEYAYGNRLVSVSGSRTSIADYEKGELIEIDRDAGTYSVTRFEAVAKARQKLAPQTIAAKSESPRPLSSSGARLTRSGRTVEFFEGDIHSPSGRQRIEVAFDRTISLSRTALEVLVGAAYPSVRGPEHDAILSAAGGGKLPPASQGAASTPDHAGYALPLEQIVRYEIEGETIELRTSVVRIDREAPPADLVSIPAGARLVESRIVAVAREVEQIDSPMLAPRKP